MSQHRQDDGVDELKTYFSTVVDWAASRFPGKTRKEMRGLPWGAFYETYGQDSYDGDKTKKRVEELFLEPTIKLKRNICQFILGGEEEPRLLDLRLFDDATKLKAYNEQTVEAEGNGVSNCPVCALSNKESERVKIYDLKQMEADHVTPWSRGGASTPDKCTMLCVRHNRAKGNK